MIKNTRALTVTDYLLTVRECGLPEWLVMTLQLPSNALWGFRGEAPR